MSVTAEATAAILQLHGQKSQAEVGGGDTKFLRSCVIITAMLSGNLDVLLQKG